MLALTILNPCCPTAAAALYRTRLLLRQTLAAAVAPADQVAPNDVVTYKWLVPERAGPGPADAGSIMWMYHSHVDEAADPAAGLMGAIIITSPGNANDDATPKDVSRCVQFCFACMWACMLVG
jgi:hypothetical protein